MKKAIGILIVVIWGVLKVSAQDSLNLYQVYHWQDTSIAPAFFINNAYNEVWGWYDSVQNREYAIMGSSIGLHFFDLTDEQNIQPVAFVPGWADNMIHRDFKNKGHYLFAVADEWNSALQVIDMSYLPDSVHVVYASDTLFGISHNIWIEGDRLYACVPRYWQQAPLAGLRMYDISEPANPRYITEYKQWGNIHDLYSRNDTVYLNAETRGLVIADLTDPLQPLELARLQSYGFQGYNHSGWLSEDGNYYVFADETHGMPMKLIEVSDLQNLNQLSYLHPSMDLNDIDSAAIPHNQVIRGDYLYVSYYYDGVYIFDISDPLYPTVVGYYDTYPGVKDLAYKGAWGVYPFLPSGRILVSDMQTGLYVLGFNGPYQTALEAPEHLLSALYPNPFDQSFHLELNQPVTDWRISLVDMMGQEIWRSEGQAVQQKWQIDLPAGLSSGVYLLRVKTPQGQITQKVLKRS